jgi:hypothetical protein
MFAEFHDKPALSCRCARRHLKYQWDRLIVRSAPVSTGHRHIATFSESGNGLPSARINAITDLRDDYADNYYQQSHRSHWR